MRVEEILDKFHITVSGTGNTINIIVPPESEDGKDVVNPGIKYDDAGNAKWSPPLQQHLDVAKHAVGTTTDDTTTKPDQADVAQAKQDEQADGTDVNRVKALAGILNPGSYYGV